MGVGVGVERGGGGTRGQWTRFLLKVPLTVHFCEVGEATRGRGQGLGREELQCYGVPTHSGAAVDELHAEWRLCMWL